MQPPARQAGGPPIWCGGRADAALARAGRLADGWISYVVTPETYRAGAGKDRRRGRVPQAAPSGASAPGICCSPGSTTATRQALDAAAATLSHRYAMDFRRAAERYAALGRPEQVAAAHPRFHRRRCRAIIVLDLVGPYEERPTQIEDFAREVLPLLADLR